jgi:pyrroline-5-carboxylate reductase
MVRKGKSKNFGKDGTGRDGNGRIAVIGAGKMGGILLQACLQRGLFKKSDVMATVQHAEKAKLLSKTLGISVDHDNVAAAQRANTILVCVKPQVVATVMKQIAGVLTPKKLVVSIAASVSTDYIQKLIPNGVPVVRAMPNTPCLVGKGMTALCPGAHATVDHLKAASRFFDVVGRTVTADEKHMDAITGLSASGPAFIYIILESLAEAGVKVGLPRDLATLLSAQTVLGAASMVLETGDHPALLKDAVTTPAGCTIDGILELEDGKLRVTLIKAVVKSAERAKDLLLQG